MSKITFGQWFPYSLVTSGALMATTTGAGTTTLTFPGLINVSSTRIKMVVVGNVIFRRSGTNPEITAYNSANGAFTCVDAVDSGLPCVAFFTPI